MQKFIDSEIEMPVDAKTEASSNQLTGTTMLKLSNVASIREWTGQQEGAGAVDQTIAYGRREIVDILGKLRDGR